ncbi:hypothetical protein [Sphingobacterium mizutaii]|nr:hypothetical protein [Sphingobacterium mizutaii]
MNLFMVAGKYPLQRQRQYYHFQGVGTIAYGSAARPELDNFGRFINN